MNDEGSNTRGGGIRVARIRKVRKVHEDACITELQRMKAQVQRLVELSTEVAMQAAQFEKKIHHISHHSMSIESMWLVTGGLSWLQNKETHVAQCLHMLELKHTELQRHMERLDAANTALDHT